MKKLIFSTLFILFAMGAIAQTSNAILFAEGGERFFVILNGLRMNEEAATNVKVEDLNAPQYKLKVVFEDKNLGEMDKNLYLEPGNEVTMNIKMNKKGAYVLRLVSQVPIAQAPPAAANTTVIHYNPNPQPVQEVTVVEQTTTTTSTGGNNGSGNTESVSMNVNVDGFGMNVNMSATDGMGGSANTNMTTTTTTTTTTTSSGMSNGGVVYEEPAPGYTGANGCAMPMGEGDFAGAKSSIAGKSFEDSKMTMAKQIAKSNCLTADQVKEILMLFDFEDTRLEFAKFAYDYAFDPGNYYKVNDAFEFESTIEELDEYISRR